MDSNNFSSSPFLVLLSSALLISIQFPLSSSFDWFDSCSNNLGCGNITGVGFPFWGDGRPGDCGYPQTELICKADQTKINITGVVYNVLKIDQVKQILRVVRTDFLSGFCSPSMLNTNFDSQIFEYDSDSGDLSLFYDCSAFPESLPLTPQLPGYFTCPKGSTYKNGYLSIATDFPLGSCKRSLSVGVPKSYYGDIGNLKKMEEALREGFNVEYKVDIGACKVCTSSMGVCGYNWIHNHTVCYCQGHSYDEKICIGGRVSASPQENTNESGGGKTNASKIGLSIAGACILVIVIGCFVYFLTQRRKKHAMLTKDKNLITPPSSNNDPTSSTNLSQSIPSYFTSKSDIEKGSTYFGVQVFSYTELEQATDHFDPSKELGDGGFGTVYYGKLEDGRVVAVKRLYENNFKRVEQFMNEVEILTRLAHRNLVKLYGCTSRRSRELLLVYEYIPNGTVADHLHGKQAKSGLLTWQVRLSIAIETAEALAYLHHSDIIHRDVKTNNILLDNDFRVKVADFGLSRLFPNDVTHVSTAPQGTPGYVDPEYYQCYQLTDKSDVYSFGVVLIELISSLQAVDTNRHRHDINLASMAINKIQNHALNELVDPSLGFEKDNAVNKMATAVAELAFRCLQQEKDMRPTMEEVLVVLKAIKKEDFCTEKAEVVDIRSDVIGLLKGMPPPLSPDSDATDKLMMMGNITLLSQRTVVS